MTLGLTDGAINYGLNTWNAQYGNAYIGKISAYGTNIGTNSGVFPAPEVSTVNKTSGITTDPTKSGIVASFSNINIGNIISLKLGKYLIRY